MTWTETLSRTPVLTDGAWGTELQARGLPPGDCPDHWNLTQPALVSEVARAYVDAGSRVILTNTFRANPITLAGHGLTAEAGAINSAGVRISLDAAGSEAQVFASIGPTGKMLLTGEVTEDDLVAAFSEQAGALARAGAHALLIETMSDLEEAKCAIKAAKPFGLPVIVSFVFDSGRNKDRTMTGLPPERVAEEITAAGADAVGANCGQGIAGFVAICQRLRASTSLPIWIKANAGLPEIVNGETVYRTSPAEFASFVPQLVAAGASFIGGCCGTSPAFIRALAPAFS